MIFVGIDPGVSGALGVLSASGQALSAMPLPLIPWQGKKRIVDGAALASMFKTLTQANVQVFAALEHAQAFPKQGISGTFNYGVGFGVVWGVLQALGISHQLVRPKIWQKVMTASGAGDPKDRARAAASHLWPAGGYTQDGIIDALLIADFGRRSWQGRLSEPAPPAINPQEQAA